MQCVNRALNRYSSLTPPDNSARSLEAFSLGERTSCSFTWTTMDYSIFETADTPSHDPINFTCILISLTSDQIHWLSRRTVKFRWLNKRSQDINLHFALKFWLVLPLVCTFRFIPETEVSALWLAEIKDRYSALPFWK